MSGMEFGQGWQGAPPPEQPPWHAPQRLVPPLQPRPTVREYGFGPPPGYPTSAGQTLGLLSLALFFTGPLAIALGFVSVSQARRGGGATRLGIAGMIAGAFVSLGVVMWILTEVWSLWDLLG